MAEVKAWAVVCHSGAIHEGDEVSFLFMDADQARDATHEDPLDEGCAGMECGPHRVVLLRGELPKAQRKEKA